MLKKYLLLVSFFLLSRNLDAQSLYFPPLAGNTWDTISPASLGWCPDRIDSLFSYLGSRKSKAFIVLKDGKIVIEKYFGTFTQDSLWYWASAGKTITSFMAGVAQQEHFLSIKDTSSRYLGTGWTACTPTQEQKITVRHQLTMTSGLDDGVPDNHCTIDTCLRYLADAGTRWAYHNGPYTMLDSVIAKATGQSLNSYISQKLKAATGITGAFYRSGYDNVFVSKARSMARFGLLILNRGSWNSTKVMTDTAYFRQMTTPSQALNKSYGYLWWLNGKASYMVPTSQVVIPGPLNPHAPADMFAAIGKNGQFLNVVPSQHLVYVRMGDAPFPGEVPFTMNDTIWQKLNAVMCSTASSPAISPEVRELSIYPNPSSGLCRVELPGQQFDIQVFDLTGRTVHRQQGCAGSAELHTQDYTGGIYYVQVRTGKDRILTKKLVVY